MNCPKCEGLLYQIATFYPSPPGRVFECSKCRERYTEDELEDWPLCAGCGKPVADQDESLCKKCLEEMHDKKLSYE